MGKIISQISALSIANAREYGITQQQKEILVTYNKELQEANRAKDKFISIISHDLKSPFNILIGFCSLLMEEIEKNNIKEIKEYGLVIQQTLENTLNLLNNLLEWSRNKSGLINFNPERLDMNELIDKTVKLLNQQALVKNITLNKTIPPGSFVFADRDMFSAIIRNLVSNAIKYTRLGGMVNISAKNDPDETVISIADNGIGMKQEKMEKLFHLEYSDSAPGTNHEKGTGLGLFLCKDFIDAHHGRIWVESEIEKGSTFYFTIPNQDS
jgi:signal transduction histidine kinase